MSFKIIKSLLIITSFIILASCNNNTGSTTNTTTNQLQVSNIQQNKPQNNYLAKPTGEYGIGFKDIHFQDNSRCPDVFYKAGVNESDFSLENTNHCREIMVRVYYPTNESTALGSPYYNPLILNTEYNFKMYASYAAPETKLDFTQFEATRSFTQENVNTAIGQFPVVLFSPGSGNSVQDYENIITNLVSHGYVVVAINSIFLSGYTALPNGHMVTYEGNDDAVHTQRSLDIEYIYNYINKINSSLSNIMDTSRIGMMGHSDGANGVAQVLSTAPQYKVNAAIAMDTDVKPSYESFNVPFMHMLSGTRYWTGKYGSPRIDYVPHYQLAKDNYLVGITPTVNELVDPPQYGPLYTTHGSFSNDETLQDLDVYQTMLPVFESLNKIIFAGNTIGSEWGTGKGFEVTKSINTYVVKFFDNYLKNIVTPVFNNYNCQALTTDTIISCGPTVFPN